MRSICGPGDAIFDCELSACSIIPIKTIANRTLADFDRYDTLFNIIIHLIKIGKIVQSLLGV